MGLWFAVVDTGSSISSRLISLDLVIKCYIQYILKIQGNKCRLTISYGHAIVSWKYYGLCLLSVINYHWSVWPNAGHNCISKPEVAWTLSFLGNCEFFTLYWHEWGSQGCTSHLLACLISKNKCLECCSCLMSYLAMNPLLFSHIFLLSVFSSRKNSWQLPGLAMWASQAVCTSPD